jgi:hypothetical protein
MNNFFEPTLKSFFIVFVRSNGTRGNDYFDARTKEEAIQSFHACYRHDNYKIVYCEEV